MRAAMEAGVAGAEAVRHRQHEGVRLLPLVPGGDRRTPRNARFLHHTGGAGHEGADFITEAREASARRDGAVHFRPSAGLPDLRGKRQLRTAGYGRSGGLARGPLRLRRRESFRRQRERRVEPVLQFRARQMHRMLALRARLRRSAGHFRADHRGPWIRLEGFSRRQAIPGFGMRFLRRVRAGVSHGHADRKDRYRKRAGGAQRHHHVRLLRRGLFVQSGDAGQRSGSHAAVQGWQGEPRTFLRQGPVLVGLRDPPGSHPEADGPREDHRSVARGELGRGH